MHNFLSGRILKTNDYIRLSFFGRKFWVRPKDKDIFTEKLKSTIKIIPIYPRKERKHIYEIYPLGWNNTFREQIRRRDEYKCQICGVPEAECFRKLDVHHIDYIKKNIVPENLVSLCRKCHAKTKGNKEHWKEYFQSWKLKLSEIKQ